MHCMAHKSHGLSFSDPYGTTKIQHIMTGFVDNTTHWVNDFERVMVGTYSTNDMYSDTQHTAQWWEQLLYATGGKLELSKCFYYPILWRHDEEGIPSLSPQVDKTTLRNVDKRYSFKMERLL